MKYFIMSFLLISLMACNSNEKCVENVNDDCLCYELYDPVCGCNDVTYGNACFAACKGIEVVANGPCQYDVRPLLGKWQFLGYGSEGAVIGNDKPSHSYNMYIQLDENKQLSGKSAINFIMGDFAITNLHVLTSNANIATKIAGKEEDLLYEQKFADKLSATNKYKIDGDYLSITVNKTVGLDAIIPDGDVMIFKKL